MDYYELTIPGVPVPRERARVGYGRSMFYTPMATRQYAHKVQVCAMAAQIKLLQGHISMEVTFYLPDRKRRDFDNLSKAITDPLNGLAWVDDSDIAWLPGGITIHKAIDKANPRVEMKWWKTDGD